jgi:hypothetical protein
LCFSSSSFPQGGFATLGFVMERLRRSGKTSGGAFGIPAKHQGAPLAFQQDIRGRLWHSSKTSGGAFGIPARHQGAPLAFQENIKERFRRSL